MLQKYTVFIANARKKCVYKNRRFLFSLLFFLASSVVNAATPEKLLTLSDAIRLALAENPSLKVFSFRDDALQGQLQTANLKPAYELGVATENFAGTGGFNGVGSAELTVSLSSTIEMGGKRKARTEIYSQSRSHQEAKRQVASLELLGEVTRRYIDVLAAQQRVILATEAAELAKMTLRVVKKRSKAGSTPEAEVKRAQAAEAQSQLALLSGQQQLSYLKVALAALWGETSPVFATVSGDLFNFGQDVDFELLYAKMETNPAIQVFAAQQRLKDAEVRLAKTESSSDINWSVGVRRFQDTSDTAITAGFSMPLFSSKRNSGAVSAALASRNEVFVQKEVALLKMHTQLFRAFSNRQQAIISAQKLQSEIVPALEDALSETQQAYERGRYGYLEYVSARQELLRARQTLIASAAAALTYGADIEQLTAEPLPASQYPDFKKITSEFKD
ncbi:MAG: cobalt-zinc-cadmium efflux system outer membrane protein [Paraglaciecola sp.]|jgi:cobalt-zinc-cadmium efflux system outer membrane protein